MSVHAIEWAWRQQVANPTQKLVLMALADHANGDGQCWPSMDRVAQLAGCSDRTARRHIDDLCDGGLVAKDERYRRRDGTLGTWTLVLQMDATSGHTWPQATDGQRPPVTEPAATHGHHQRPQVTAHEPSVEPSGEPSPAHAPASEQQHDSQPAKKTRKRDELFEAIAETCELDWSQMTKGERGKANKAAKELREVGATPDGVRARAAEFRRRWPHCDVTPTGLANNYSQLGKASPPDCGDPQDAITWVTGDDGVSYRVRKGAA